MFRARALLPSQMSIARRTMFITVVTGALFGCDNKAPSAHDQATRVLWNIDAETDFSLDQKRFLHKAALQVIKDNPNCGQITDGYFGDDDNTFYVTCTAADGREPFNVTFTSQDVTAGRSLALPKPYPEAGSRKLCEQAILERSTHPSTVDFYRITGYATTEATNGNREIRQRFDAKNGFNLKLTYEARCLILPNGEVEVAINEVPGR